MDIKRRNFNKKCLDKLFQAVGFKGYNEDFVRKNKIWYHKKYWTKAQESDFREWYIKNYMKSLGVMREQAEHDWEWFCLGYGWKLKD